MHRYPTIARTQHIDKNKNKKINNNKYCTTDIFLITILIWYSNIKFSLGEQIINMTKHAYENRRY